MLALLLVGGMAGAATPKVDDDVYAFIEQIAEPTAEAQLSGGQSFEKVVTLSRVGGELGVSGMQVLGKTQHPDVDSSAAAIMIVHYKAQCDSPSGLDDYPVTQGVATFVVSASGEKIFEIGKVNGTISIRLLRGEGAFGPWEAYQADPAGYTTYHC